jgi:hypothetical protein
MPARKKKSTAKPKESKAGISINIKNVMKQIQNERQRPRPRQRQRTDFIMPVSKDPSHNLNNGSMTRMFAPAITYASTPLSAFPSLASVEPIRGGRPQPQLESNSKQPLALEPSIVHKPEVDEKNDPLENPRLGIRLVKPTPVVPTMNTAREPFYSPIIHGVTPPLNIGPSFLSQTLFGTNIEDLEADAMDNAQLSVARQTTPFGLYSSHGTTPLSSARSTPSIHPWAEAGHGMNPSIRYARAASSSYDPNVPKVPLSNVPKPLPMRKFGAFPSGRKYEVEEED